MPDGSKEVCRLVRPKFFFLKKKSTKKKGALFAKMNVLSGGQSKDDQGPLDGVQTVWAWRSSSVYAALSQYVPVASPFFTPD